MEGVPKYAESLTQAKSWMKKKKSGGDKDDRWQ